MVIIGMIGFVIITDTVASEMGVYVGLLPVVILTMAIERCWMLELEDGVVNMLLTVLGTLFATTVICFVFRWRVLVDTLFLMPESVLIIIAAMLLIGRYTGFRVSELLRFRAIAHDA
jgi:hypothetical protein